MKLGALKVRQQFGKILDSLHVSEPIIIEKNGEEIGVLISINDYRERFLDLKQQDEIDSLVDRFRALSKNSKKATNKISSTKRLRELRDK